MKIKNALANQLRNLFPEEFEIYRKGKYPSATRHTKVLHYCLGYMDALEVVGKSSPYIQINIACGRLDRLFVINPEIVLSEDTNE